MQKVTYLFLFALAVMAQAEEKPHYDLSKGKEYFDKFIKDYNKEYKDEADKNDHYLAFVESLKVINDANTPESSATYAINQFADYTSEERMSMHGGVFKRLRPAIGMKV